MEISAKLVMSLRDKTLLPMMKCKEALAATSGYREDLWIESAMEWIRKQGINLIGKSDKEILNGGIGFAIIKNRGCLVHLGCQTDFVSNSDVFKELVTKLSIADIAFAGESRDSNLAEKDIKVNGSSPQELITTASNKLGETLKVMDIKRLLCGVEEVVVGYNHDGKVAALISGSGDERKLKNIVLHIVAANPAPIAVNIASVDISLIEKEKQIIFSLTEVQSKSPDMQQKILMGKLGRFFKQSVLFEQEMLIDAEKKETVAQYIKRNGLTVSNFVRMDVSKS